MALTATATPSIRSQLSSMLRDPTLAISTVNKANISLTAVELKKLPKNGKFYGTSLLLIQLLGTETDQCVNVSSVN